MADKSDLSSYSCELQQRRTALQHSWAKRKLCANVSDTDSPWVRLALLKFMYSQSNFFLSQNIYERIVLRSLEFGDLRATTYRHLGLIMTTADRPRVGTAVGCVQSAFNALMVPRGRSTSLEKCWRHKGDPYRVPTAPPDFDYHEDDFCDGGCAMHDFVISPPSLLTFSMAFVDTPGTAISEQSKAE